ncbi:MAG: bifunctional metallophosphatase/5'-nucleotidase [Coriobacteriales bacterium]|nr:bifunctional metallophosphatase/5'-nucleotidase [Coriobacteriales bacterium]
MNKTVNIRRLFIFALVASLSLAISISFISLSNPNKSQATTGDICILATNDIHTSLDATSEGSTQKTFGYAEVAGYYQDMKTTYGDNNVCLVDAGDLVQGSSYGALTKGTFPVNVMSMVGYSVATVGNHEFDYGADYMYDLLSGTVPDTTVNFQTTSCNIYRKDTGGMLTRQYLPYIIKNLNGTKVAFVGVTTPEALTKTAPSHFHDDSGNMVYNFSEDENGQALYNCVQNAINDCRTNESPDFVILLAHLGQEGMTDKWRSDTLMSHINGVDAVLDGHSHEKYNKIVKDKDNKDIAIVQAGYQAEGISKLILNNTAAPSTVSATLVTPGSVTITPDSTVQSYITSKKSEIDAGISDPFATTTNKLVATDLGTGETEGMRLARVHETNLGDLVADSFRDYFHADIGFENGGGLRNNVDAGPVSMKSFIDVMPFFNTIACVRVSGQTILDALEMSARLYPQENGGFLHPSGLTYEIRSDIESTVVLDSSNSFVRVDGARRVQNVKVAGNPIDPSANYTVVGSDFWIVQGGDGYSMFKGATIVSTTMPADLDVVKSYIVTKLGSVIAEPYDKALGMGRIVVKDGPDPVPDPVPDPEPNPADNEDEVAGASSQTAEYIALTLAFLGIIAGAVICMWIHRRRV